MTFAEKLRKARKESGMSQELLAEKLGVSRQAVTKWETDKGIPDIENMIVISNLFGISLDELLSNEKHSTDRRRFLYESKTEYDIDGPKIFDMKLGGAAALMVKGHSEEKVIVLLASNDIDSVAEDFKVKIDDLKRRIDIDVKRKNKMTEAKAKEGLFIEVLLPDKYLDHIEIECNCNEIGLDNLVCENIEYKGKTSICHVASVKGTLEVDSNSDLSVDLDDFEGSFELNQVSATSRLSVPADYDFCAVVKGIKNSITYEVGGVEAEDFSAENSKNTIELNGSRSELVICKERAVEV